MQRDNRTTYNQPNRSSAQTNRAVSGQSRANSPQASSTKSANAVVCRKCKSQQIVANKKGYSFVKLFKTLGWMGLFPLILVVVGAVVAFYYQSNVRITSGISSTGSDSMEILLVIIGIICWITVSLSLPVGILVGFIGRSEIVNGCMNCGFKWRPAKRK